MQLPLNTKIAGDKTVKHWNDLKPLIVNFKNEDSWQIAYKEYFLKRLEDRYLIPIKSIKGSGIYNGEGFSIMTIICSLVEFLESTYLGMNYKYRKSGDPPLGRFEYNKSEVIFVSFLTNRSPFCKHFDKARAEGFYKNVRCGLLHEARTKGNWKILGHSKAGKLIEQRASEIIVYRNDFFKAVESFINEYEALLLSSDDRKEAFIRKFDQICDE